MKKCMLVFTVFLSTVSPFATAHAACVDDVDAFARQHGLNTAAPAAGTKTVMSDKLAASGGVIAPPSTLSADMVIKPPAMSPEPMETAPGMVPQAGGMTAPGDTSHNAASTAQAESLLASAREAGSTGDEASCQQHLVEAGKLMGDAR